MTETCPCGAMPATACPTGQRVCGVEHLHCPPPGPFERWLWTVPLAEREDYYAAVRQYRETSEWLDLLANSSTYYRALCNEPPEMRALRYGDRLRPSDAVRDVIYPWSPVIRDAIYPWRPL